jgi:hypothetical protein
MVLVAALGWSVDMRSADATSGQSVVLSYGSIEAMHCQLYLEHAAALCSI